MKIQAAWAVLSICLVCVQNASFAQKAPAERTVAVAVVDAHTEPAKPVAAVRVELSYLDGSVTVSEARDVTNPKGQAWLDVSESAAQRGGLRIAVDGASNLVIFEPADGQLPALPATIKVSMLPKGSAALLGPTQIEAMLHRTLLQVSSLRKQVSALKQNVAVQDQRPDLGAAIAEWARGNGFSAAQVDQQVQQWAEAIQKQSSPKTAEQKALAELPFKHYANAAQLFNDASDADRQQIGAEATQEQALGAQLKALQSAQQALLDKEQTALRQLLDHSQQAAGAYQLNLQYHQATHTLEDAETTAAAEYRKHPDDKGLHELWLRAVRNAANGRRAEGEIASGDQSLPLLARSAVDFELITREYAALGDQLGVAGAQNELGYALWAEGERTSGDQAMALLDQAVQACQKALEVETKAAQPAEWARVQANLGNALLDEGERSSADRTAGLLDHAVQAYRKALEVITKSDVPQDWAKIQNNLGLALMEEGGRASTDKASALLDQAVEAYERALEVRTKAESPQDWAWTETDLGIALDEEANRAIGDKAVSLLAKSIKAYEQALEVRTKANMPQAWARTQIYLGNAFTDEGGHASGDAEMALFDQGLQAYRNALEVLNKAELPQDWALVETNLAGVLMAKAEGTRGDAAVALALLEQSIQSNEMALEVYTKSDLPQDWARTQFYIGNALVDEAARSAGDKVTPLLDQAVQAFQSALQVQTKADLPQAWAQTQMRLGDALLSEGENVDGDKGSILLDQSLQAYQNALEELTQDSQPASWLNMQMNSLELELVSGQFAACIQQIAVLSDGAVQPPLRLVRDVFELACRFGYGAKSPALARERAILANSSHPAPGLWDFNGVNRFLSKSPAFETGRASWIALFNAVENGDNAGMTAALHELEPLLQR